MNEDEKPLGYTVDGKPLYLWTQINAWTNRVESFLSVGTESIQFDHFAPELAPALIASLSRESGRAAA